MPIWALTRVPRFHISIASSLYTFSSPLSTTVGFRCVFPAKCRTMFWRIFHKSDILRYNPPSVQDGSWALITGASDGIGKGIARELLSHGFNVILHGRNASKLDGVRAELVAGNASSNQKVETWAWDATTPLQPGAVNLAEELLRVVSDRRLTVLVNNCGFSSTYHSFNMQDPVEIDRILTLQIGFATQLTRILIPVMCDHPSLILNISGLTAAYPCPLLAVHSGGKAYIRAWSRALSLELRMPPEENDHQDVDSESPTSSTTNPKAQNKLTPTRNLIEVLAIDVHNVASNSNHSSPSFFTPDSETMARAIIGVVGCGRLEVTAYWRAELMSKTLSLLPRSMVDNMLVQEMVKMRSIERQKESNAAKAV
ncbi:hypothetical protein BKA62DRAFT_691028 [Auriculariales sp. MPI-PUGE-AT-0066]|nr:hypothetical protein BKA62DRAFT_691028 [Auriculariales sp. MPI-PUGE-AT-0066]